MICENNRIQSTYLQTNIQKSPKNASVTSTQGPSNQNTAKKL